MLYISYMFNNNTYNEMKTIKQQEFIQLEIRWIKRKIEYLKHSIKVDEEFDSKWKPSGDGLTQCQLQTLYEKIVKLKMEESGLEVLQKIDTLEVIIR